MGGKQSKHQKYQYHHNAYQGGHPSIGSSSPYPSYSQGHVSSGSRSSLHLQSRYKRIGDDYRSLGQVTAALAQAGLESSNLIVGIDFTKSNEWTGAQSFNHRSLHHLGDSPNPYEQAISIIGRTLAAFDEDNLIPCYGFGDASTHDEEVFSFYPAEAPCNGFEEVLGRYRELVPHIRLAGPTSFAPIIETATRIVDNSGGQYHVLMIIADGQVTRSVNTSPDQLSPQEQNSINALVKASEYPLSVVLVGVGDGPWDIMRQFDDNVPSRAFDNFQFVNFTEIMLRNTPASKKETDFALEALMEIPLQYKATIDLQLLGCRRGNTGRVAIPPPPLGTYRSVNSSPASSQPTSLEQRTRSHYTPQPAAEISSPNRNCPVCLLRERNLAFGCGHQTCHDCGRDMFFCPVCRTQITTKIKLYG